MIFKRYKTKEDFLNDNLETLLKEEAKNETMIGIVLQHEEAKVNKWLLARVESYDGDVEAIIVVDDDKEGLVLYFPKERVDIEVLKFIIDNIMKLNIDLKEILVPARYSKNISEIYVNLLNKKIKNISKTYTYKLENLNEEYILDNNEKLIKLEEEQDDIKHLVKIVKEIHTDIYNKEECSDEEAMKIAQIYLKKGIFLLTNNDETEIYTQVVQVRKQINGSAIGAVITPKEYRGKGYGKKCIYAVCKRLLEEGNKFIVLHVATENYSAINVYEKIGFKKVSENERIVFEN